MIDGRRSVTSELAARRTWHAKPAPTLPDVGGRIRPTDHSQRERRHADVQVRGDGHLRRRGQGLGRGHRTRKKPSRRSSRWATSSPSSRPWPAARARRARRRRPARSPRRRSPSAASRSKSWCTFTRQFSTLQDAGLPVLRSLRILERQMKPGVLKNALIDVVDDVESRQHAVRGVRQAPASASTGST